jgi:hypothetical protein
MKLVTCAITLSLTAMSFSANAAAVLPAFTSTASVNTNFPDGTPASTGPFSASLEGGTASVVVSPFVNLQAQVSDAAGVGTQDAAASLDYYFEVVGGTPGAIVPVLVQTNLFAMSSGYPNDASASITVGGFGGVGQTATAGDAPISPNSSQFSGTLAISATDGQATEVFLSIIAEESYALGGSASASADPFIFVDPLFADAADYSIVLSDGVGNGLSSTPLPASLPLFACGLGFVGYMTRRRKYGQTLPA